MEEEKKKKNSRTLSRPCQSIEFKLQIVPFLSFFLIQ